MKLHQEKESARSRRIRNLQEDKEIIQERKRLVEIKMQEEMDKLKDMEMHDERKMYKKREIEGGKMHAKRVIHLRCRGRR